MSLGHFCPSPVKFLFKFSVHFSSALSFSYRFVKAYQSFVSYLCYTYLLSACGFIFEFFNMSLDRNKHVYLTWLIYSVFTFSNCILFKKSFHTHKAGKIFFYIFLLKSVPLTLWPLIHLKLIFVYGDNNRDPISFSP